MMNAAGIWERLDDEKGLSVNLRGEREFAWLFHQTAGYVLNCLWLSCCIYS